MGRPSPEGALEAAEDPVLAAVCPAPQKASQQPSVSPSTGSHRRRRGFEAVRHHGRDHAGELHLAVPR
jgi:hypothetical protein